MFKKLFLVAAVATSFLFTACNDDEATTPTPVTPTVGSIVQVAQGDTSFSWLVNAVVRAGLAETLSNPGTYTVFAPTNNAFRASGVNEALLTTGLTVDELKEVLLYHVLGVKAEAAQVTTGYFNTLADGPVAATKLSMYINKGTGVKINGSVNVVRTDIQASNGVIHVIDSVIFPADMATLAAANPNLSTVVGAAVATGVVNSLVFDPMAANELTLFAPLNSAFTTSGLDLSTFTTAQLTDVLLYHVVNGNVRSSQVTSGTVPTLNANASLNIQVAGGVITINPGMGNINNARVQTADIQAVNGVIHIIDRLLVPSN